MPLNKETVQPMKNIGKVLLRMIRCYTMQCMNEVIHIEDCLFVSFLFVGLLRKRKKRKETIVLETFISKVLKQNQQIPRS